MKLIFVLCSFFGGISKKHAQNGRGVERTARKSGEVLFCFAACVRALCALQAADDGQLILKKISQAVAEAVNQSDNYICAQDLARFYYFPPKPAMGCQQPPAIPNTPLRVQDRLKLDVAVSQGAEIYSWHGEHKFSAATVADIVHEGPISSGSFNGYLRNIFGEHGVTFIFRGRSKENGVELYHFDYDVPVAASHYRLQAGKDFVLAPFHGSFAAKTDSFELYSLTVIANGDQIPLRSDICSAETRLTYQLVKLSTHESLLPSSFDLLMGSRNGIFTDSKGRYSECREYAGESTVHFDGDDTAQQIAAPAEFQSKPLNSGISLPIVLRGEIDEDTAYAGLPVDAVLAHDVKIKKGTTLSRGATLQGTITRFQIFHQPMHQVSMKIEFNRVTDGNKLYLCDAIHDVANTLLPTYAGGRGRGRGRGMPMQTNISTEPTDGSLIFNTPHLHLDKRFTSNFITIAQSETESR